MSSGTGGFSVIIGRGTRTDTGTLTLEKLFSSNLQYQDPAQCPNGYTKQSGDKLYLSVAFNAGQGIETLSPLEITYSPYSLDTVNVAGVSSTSVLRVDGKPASPLTSNMFDELMALINGTSSQYLKNADESGAILLTGNVGIGTTAATATLHLKAGTASPNTAPLKLSAGTNLTTPEPGAIEFDGTSLFYTTDAGVRKTLGTAGAGVTALTGDVTASGSGSVSATVNSVGGSTAANINSAVVAVNTDATSNSTASVLVKRDASGSANFKAIKMDGSGSGTFTQSVPAAVTSYSVTWPAAVAGSANSVLASDTSGNLSWINLGSIAGMVNLGSQVTGVLPIASGGTNSSSALNNNQLMASNGGAIKELGAMTDGQIVVGKTSNPPQIVSMNGDVTINNTGATTVGKIAGTTVSGVGLASNSLLQNTSGSAISGNSVLVSNGTGTGVTALSSPASGILTSSGGVPSWSNLGSDTFTQYALLAGRSTGQVLNGGTNASGTLTLDSTANGTKGNVLINPTGGNVGIGTTTPSTALEVNGTLKVPRIDSNHAPLYRGTGLASISSKPIRSAGQITLTNGSSSIVGIGTNFIGDRGPSTLDYWYYFSVDSKIYPVASISSDSSAVLADDNFNPVAWTGPTQTVDLYVSGSNASGQFSTAIGQLAVASNTESVAIGGQTLASGDTSTAIGYRAKATNSYSTAIGLGTRASGITAMAIGDSTTASGSASLAMGNATTASGMNSTAMGYSSTAAGSFSFASGNQTLAPSYAQVSLGAFNSVSGTENATSWVATDPLLTVGNGTSSVRATAFTILKNGKVGIGTTTPATKLDVVGTNGTTLKIVDGNQAANKVLTSDANGVASWAALPASAPATSGTSILKGNGSGGFSNAVANTDYLGTTGANTVTTLGTITTGTWNGTSIAVAYGGTGATTASGARTNLSAAASGANSDITSLAATTSVASSGALSLSAGGSNQNVTISPSGTGYTILNGSVGIGTTIPGSPLDVQTTTDSIGISSSSSAAGSKAISGVSTGVAGYGVYGRANSAYAVYGTATNGYGIYGMASTNGTGVFGTSSSGYGGQFQTSTGTAGLFVSNLATTGASHGANISTASSGGYGVYVTNTSSGGAAYLSSTSGNALITGSGNVGIGSTTPAAKLDISGQARTKSFTQTTGTVDFANGNTIITSFNCASAISFANLLDGASYTLVVTDTSTTQCTFNTTTTGSDAGTLTFRFIPANGIRTASSHTVYSLQRAGTSVYVSWITGF